jgi:hypothetical protein
VTAAHHTTVTNTILHDLIPNRAIAFVSLKQLGPINEATAGKKATATADACTEEEMKKKLAAVAPLGASPPSWKKAPASSALRTRRPTVRF